MDYQNAFNAVEVWRAGVFNAAVGVATQFYDEGKGARAGDQRPHRDARLPCLLQGPAHYERGAELGYSARDSRDRVIIWGETGLQQGDQPASALFSMALYPVIMLVMDLYPTVFAVLYMDTIYLVGPLDMVLAAASDAADRMWEDLNLKLNVEESWVHVLAWADIATKPDAYGEALREFPSLSNLPLKQKGAKCWASPLAPLSSAKSSWWQRWRRQSPCSSRCYMWRTVGSTSS
eukprot:645330-Rhodomonas_salina.2